MRAQEFLVLEDVFAKWNMDSFSQALLLFGKCILIALVCRILIAVINKFIRGILKGTGAINSSMTEQKQKTLGTVLQNVTKYALYFIAILMILSMFGIPTGSILAAAGVGGVAIGLGAQNMVKDVISGFFILFEDQYGVGDYVELGGKAGKVEALELRITKLLDFDGRVHVIPNGNITTVTNYSRNNSRAMVKISIAYEEDINKAISVLEQECDSLAKQHASIIATKPIVWGVTDLGSSGVEITVVAYAKPLDHLELERIMRKAFKEAFDKNGIEIPYQKQVVYLGQNNEHTDAGEKQDGK